MLSGTDSIKIHGEYFPVRARMVEIDGLSAHADYLELIKWLSKSAINPKKTFIVHGEPQSQDAFRRHIRDHLGWESFIPSQGDAELLT
jgi:metallo-beta-lactamase family protein